MVRTYTQSIQFTPYYLRFRWVYTFELVYVYMRLFQYSYLYAPFISSLTLHECSDFRMGQSLRRLGSRSSLIQGVKENISSQLNKTEKQADKTAQFAAIYGSLDETKEKSVNQEIEKRMASLIPGIVEKKYKVFCINVNFCNL